MIYFKESRVVIRSMVQDDCLEFAEAFKAQDWDKPKNLFEDYYRRQKSEQHLVCIAEVDKQVAGYVTLLKEAPKGPFASEQIPEIVDFNVLIRYQNKGIGSILLKCVEDLAKEYSNKVSLAVGLHYGYGGAQRLYIKSGYIPDGSGVWYQGKQLEQYTECMNDDDLVLYFSKELK